MLREKSWYSGWNKSMLVGMCLYINTPLTPALLVPWPKYSFIIWRIKLEQKVGGGWGGGN